jgi:hypothetical protein
MDFNVMNMTAVFNVIRDGLPLTLAELTKVRDTPQMASLLKARFQSKGHAIVIYPDARAEHEQQERQRVGPDHPAAGRLHRGGR